MSAVDAGARGALVAGVARRTIDNVEPFVQSIRSGGGRARAFGSDARDEVAVTALDPKAKAALVAHIEAAGA